MTILATRAGCLFTIAAVISAHLTVACAAERVTDPKTGIDQKVIVTKKEGVGIFDAPGGANVGSLPAMQIRFVVKTDDQKEFADAAGEKWYRISSSGDESVGWVAGSGVTIWKTRSALKPNDLANSVKGREFIVKSKDNNPMNDVIYDGAAPDNYQLLAPILSPRTTDDEPYDVFVFGGTTQGTFAEKASGTKAAPADFSSSQFEIVFAVDTTASMTPLLDGVKEVVAQIATIVGGIKDEKGALIGSRVRFGFVEYQDRTPGLTPSRITIPLTDASTFVSKVRDVHVADIGSGEWEEDVVAGLSTALDRRPDGAFSGRVGWSENSSKHIILCGDASPLPKGAPKNSTSLTIEDVLKSGMPEVVESRKAAQMQVGFHAILALNEQGKSDWEDGRKAFKEVSEGLGRFPGAYTEMNANDVADKDRVVKLFADKIKIGVDVLAGKPVTVEQRNSSELAIGIYRNRDGTPVDGVKFGTAHERNTNDQVVAIETWFLRYVEMQRLKSRLTFLRDSLQTLSATERKSSDRILDALAVVFATAGVGQPVATNKLSDVVKDVPLKNDVLNLTLDDISRMDDQAFKQWLNRLTVCEKRCEELLSIGQGGKGLNQWMVLGDASNPGAAGELLVTFIPVDQLP